MLRTLTACLALVVGLPAMSQGQQRQPPAPSAERPAIITAIPGVIAQGVSWTRAWQGPDNADGIVGTPDGGLLFAQEQPSRVLTLDPTDRVSVFADDTHGTGSLSLDTQGRLFAAERTCTDPGRPGPACTEPTAIAIISPRPQRKTIANAIDGRGLGRINDLIVDGRGGAFFTSGGAFHTDAQGHVTTIGDNLRTNGIMLSPDGRTLYVTNGGVVVAFDVQPDGTTGNQRDFARLEAGGSGDGLCIDADGRLYVTSAPGVQVFGPDGTFLGVIPTPRAVISVAFAGPDRRTLYVVGSGARNPDGTEATTPPGVRNNAKTIYRIQTLAQGFSGRPK